MQILSTLTSRIKCMLGSWKRLRGTHVPDPAKHRHRLVGPAELWRMKREFQISFLRSQGLEPGHTLLDLGCGTLRGGLPLIKYLEVGHYCGVEAREEVLAEGRKELAETGLAGKRPRLQVVADLADLDLGCRFDYIWAFSVLIHMSDDVLDGALGFVARHLNPDGVFLANVNVGAQSDGHWQGFPLVWRSLDFYRAACARNTLSLADLGPLRALGHVSGDDPQDDQRMLAIRHAASGV